MPYIEGFVAAVPTGNRDVYTEHAKQAAEYFKDLGATRLIECLGGRRAAGRGDRLLPGDAGRRTTKPSSSAGSSIRTRRPATAANEKMSADPEAMEMEMPFDCSRMFWGGFQPVLDE
jgi:uncharacterized protein YbaA (DUF1428 family)